MVESFFNMLFGCPRANLDHYWGDSLPHPMLFSVYWHFLNQRSPGAFWVITSQQGLFQTPDLLLASKNYSNSYFQQFLGQSNEKKNRNFKSTILGHFLPKYMQKQIFQNYWAVIEKKITNRLPKKMDKLIYGTGQKQLNDLVHGKSWFEECLKDLLLLVLVLIFI